MHTQGRQHGPGTRTSAALRALAAAVLALTALAAGCSDVLFPKKEPRTQYERYDEVRNQNAPPYIEDEYGRLSPNLRARLTPKK